MIYLDNNATTSLAPEVQETLLSLISSNVPLNPSSSHALGQKAQAILLNARKTLASYCQAKESEIYFLSSGTEAINLYLRGFLLQQSNSPCHILTSNVEHSAVKKTLASLKEIHSNLAIQELPADRKGYVNASDVASAIRPETKLLCFIAVNNETGAYTPIQEISTLAKQHKIPLFLDSVNAFGKIPAQILALADIFVCSGHKIHAPQGSAALIMRKQYKVPSLTTGGGQENNWRSGTQNMLAISGLATAIDLLKKNEHHYLQQMQQLKQHFIKSLRERFPKMSLHPSENGAPNTINVSFPHLSGETLLILLDRAGIAASHGSACSSGAREPSSTLLAMGIPLEEVKRAIRFSLSRYTTLEEIEKTVSILSLIADKFGT
jgi:cysteine desulfurase